MITPLRRRHRLMLCIATLTLPAALWMAVNAREQVPLMAAEALPGPPVAERGLLQHWGRAGFLGRGEVESSASGERRLVVGLSAADAHPRSLLYWVPTATTELGVEPDTTRADTQSGAPDSARTDPSTARFLTVLESAPVRVTLPDEAAQRAGALVLWDVARGVERDRIELKAVR